MENLMIPVFKPLIEKEEFAAANNVLTNGWLGMGSYVGEFEEEVSKLLNLTDKHVVAVSTGHAALHLAMLLFDIGPDDEVITPSFNNIADFQAILAVGAKPVFCDVSLENYCLDPDDLLSKITKKTKALIVTHFTGNSCEIDKICKIVKEKKIKLIEDCAQAHGTKYKDKYVGNFGDAACYSFYATKHH